MAFLQASPTSVSLNFLKSAPVIPPAAVIFSVSYNSSKVSLDRGSRFLLQCSNFVVAEPDSGYCTEEEYKSGDESDYGEELQTPVTLPPMLRRRSRYRKMCPGEIKGITEEMRFVAMKLRKRSKLKNEEDVEELEIEKESNGASWEPSLEGFLKYLVDSRLIFNTIERIVDESTDVSYVYFRNTGLERTNSISIDLKRLTEQGSVIPDPSIHGTTYSQYLQELSEKNPFLFLCHFYNIYFSHIAGGQVIAKQVSNLLFEGSEMEFFKWKRDPEELLKGVREKLNALAEHWSREEKNKCLREVTKTFRFIEQIVRLIIS